jgi:hypothetical protein
MGCAEDASDLAGQDGIGSGRLRQHAVLASSNELGANLLGEDLLDLKIRTAVLNRRNADDLDVVGQKRSPPGQGVSAARARQRSVRISAAFI